MAYTSNINLPTIDDSNYQQYAQMAYKIGEFGSGYIPRNFQAKPFGSIKPKYSGPVFDEKEIKERIQEKEQKHKSGLFYLHQHLKMPILDQGQYGYCWMYGTVMAMMLAYAKAGPYVPHLSAASCAAKGKNYRNEGGLAEEALRYIDKFGVSTIQYWPDGGVADPKYNTPEQRANAALHKAVEWEELPTDDPRALWTCLVLDIPCTGGFDWWGHLVALAQLCIGANGGIEIIFPNSWTKRYGNQGWGKLAGSKARPFESFALRTAKPARAA